ncbi:MAG: hypothetical protein Q8O32_00595 [bacterium]|nr:hypothetical protein [bacterium]
MEFKKLVKECGFGLAVILQWPKPSQDQNFLDTTTIYQWGEVYTQATVSSEVENFAYKAMIILGKDDFLVWWNVCRFNHCEKLNLLALTKMCDYAKTLDQWFEIYNRAPKGVFKEIAFGQLRRLANEP